MSAPTLTDQDFHSLGLHPTLKSSLDAAGFTLLTPIQALTLIPALAGEDVAGQAQTGTGKTAAFLVTVFQRLLSRPARAQRRDNDPRALILAPTRELALQIHKDATSLGSETGLRLGLAFGGVDYEKQRNHLAAGVDVIIGTPGRLIDFFKQKVFGLGNCEMLVIDEADRMFDLGFIADLRYLMRRLPPREERQSMLFSATLSYRVLELAYEHMNSPRKLQVEDEGVTAARVTQRVFFPATEEKLPLLLGLLAQTEAVRSIIFVNTKHVAERVHRRLSQVGLPAAILSGDVPQKKRMKLLERFSAGEVAVLVATDVAARGLHIPDVSHVFNYDLPQDAEDYVHRIGRTARFGSSGDAVSFACEQYAISLPEIEAYIGMKLPTASISKELLQMLPKPMIVSDEIRAEASPEGLKADKLAAAANQARKPAGKRSGSRGGPGGGGGRPGGGQSRSGPQRPPRAEHSGDQQAAPTPKPTPASND
jgi:ATP-dependent RNA helicase RhlB